MPKALEISKESIIDLYINKNHTIDEMREILGVKSRQTMIKYMRQHNIESRDTNHERSLINKLNMSEEMFKEVIHRKYIVERFSMNELAQMYGVSHVIIDKYLKKFNISIRNHKEANAVSNAGSGNPKWAGGRRKREDGYILIHNPEHPHSSHGYVYEHRLIMEKCVGRLLSPDEHVHHINENKSDNRIENLMLLHRHDHLKLHGLQRRKKA